MMKLIYIYIFYINEKYLYRATIDTSLILRYTYHFKIFFQISQLERDLLKQKCMSCTINMDRIT